MSVERDDPRLHFVPVEEAAKPPKGLIDHIADRWWSVDPERGLIFFRARKSHPLSPQCNPSEHIARRLQKGLYPWADVQFVPSAFMRADPRDYG